MTTRNQRIRAAQKRGDIALANERIKQKKFVDKHPVGEGCEKCPEHSLAACFGDNCAKKCCGPNDSEYKRTQVVPMSPNMNRGGKTKRKKRKKRRKSRKKTKKTKRRRKRTRKTRKRRKHRRR